jgi:hypothetical protein
MVSEDKIGWRLFCIPHYVGKSDFDLLPVSFVPRARREKSHQERA